MNFFFKLLIGMLLIGGFQTSMFSQDCTKLIWSDEFDGNSLDTNKWNYDIGNGCPELCGWGNNEQQFYSDSSQNISVGNGLLTITAKQDSLGGMMYSSARINTQYKGDFRYGRMEARMRLPESQGMWPAFWMLGTEEKFGEWPRSGEIDIMELLGHKPNEVLGTIHTGLPWTFKSDTFYLPPTESFADTFHVFSLEWSPDTIQWFVDGSLYHEMTSDSLSPWQPFQQDFHLLLNVAVGGNLPGPVDSSTVLPQVMEVDYVRVYNAPDQLQIFGEQPIIGATGISYRTFAIQGADYIWSVPAGASIVSGQGTPAITVDWDCTAGDVMLELQTDCDTALLSYTIGAFAEVQMVGSAVVAESQPNLSFQIPGIAGGTYSWSVPSDATITAGQGTHAISVDWGCLQGEVMVSAFGTCGGLGDTLSVSLQTYAIKGPATVAANSFGRGYSLADISGATYNWSVPGDANIVSGQGTAAISVDFGVQEGDVSVLVTTSCSVQTYNIAITIDPSTLFCDFDGTDLDWDVFGGGNFEKVANPFMSGINTSANVGKAYKETGAQNWGGIYADLPGEMDLDNNAFLHMKVYSEKTGVVKFKIEDQTTGVPPIEIDLNQDSINQWINLIWDFGAYPTGTFDRIALFFDFGETDSSFWYFDDLFGRSYTTVGLEELPVPNIDIFPNPTNGSFRVQLNGLFADGEGYQIQILDGLGRVVHEEHKQANQDSHMIHLQGLTNGRYFVRLVGPRTQYVKAMVKTD